MLERERTRTGAVRLSSSRGHRRRRPFDWLGSAPYIDALGVAASVFGGMTVTTRAVTLGLDEGGGRPANYK